MAWLRYLLIALCLLPGPLGLVAWAIASLWPEQSKVPAGPPVRFADRFERILRECKTREDLHRVMGCPPGDYATSGGARSLPRDLGNRMLQNSKSEAPIKSSFESWRGDDCSIYVELDGRGGVNQVWIIYAPKPGDPPWPYVNSRTSHVWSR